MLELDRLTRRFGATVALDGLSFSVPAGTIFGFVGPNGAGKTTGSRLAAIQDPDGDLARVLSLVPPISAMVMPPRMAAGDVPILDVILSVSLMLVATAILIPVAARLYEGFDPAPGPARGRAGGLGQPPRRAQRDAGRLTRVLSPGRGGVGPRRGRRAPRAGSPAPAR